MASAPLSIDNSNSVVSFKLKKLGLLTVKGTLTDFAGEVSFSRENQTDTDFDVCVSSSTVDTGSAKRDEHLKNQDFFDVNTYPNICFKSTSVQPQADGYNAVGELTMLGVTREVTIPFTFSDGAFMGKFAINRLDYKLGKKIPAFIVGKTVEITIKCSISN
jgi:polyisoprenoid-binding protein YceI